MTSFERNILYPKSKPLAECKSNMAIYGQTDKPFYIKKSGCDEYWWEGEWDRVQRLRKERNSLFVNGGKQS